MPISSSGLKTTAVVVIDYVAELVSVIDLTYTELVDLSETRAAWRPPSGGWSIKEVLGHLIDSASNNHERFVRARWKEDLNFPGYDQDAWVLAQKYHDAPFRELLDLWRLLNRHISRVMQNTPEEIRLVARKTHNLDQIAWKTIPQTDTVTLDYFMRDYVGHLKHHLAQIDSLLRQSAGI